MGTSTSLPKVLYQAIHRLSTLFYFYLSFSNLALIFSIDSLFYSLTKDANYHIIDKDVFIRGFFMKCTIGFDAYIDKLVKVVKTRESAENCTFFNDITDFSYKVKSMAGLSGDIEVVKLDERFGGNAPIMAHALASLGESVTLVAPTGKKDAFKDLKCTLFDLGEPAPSLNLEFDDGKVMFGECSILNDISIDYLKKIGLYDKVIEVFTTSDFIGLCNWTQMENILPLYADILKSESKIETVFFDLADFSKKPEESVFALFNLIKSVNNKIRIIVGLNENEANILSNTFSLTRIDDRAQFTKELSQKAGCEIVIHAKNWSALSNGDYSVLREGKLVQKPKISTGGGDHFNAGFSYGLINNMSIEDNLDFAMGTSGVFVSCGESPTKEMVEVYLKEI